MKQIRSLAFFFFLATQLWASPGDTTRVRVHDDVDMTWYVRYREKALFPTQGTDFHRVNMVFTLGCASSGCSDWDYTVLIKVLHRTGEMDSTYTLDTLSTNPLVIDTNWTPFEVIEPYELGRMITPYGGYMANGGYGYDNNWEHRYVYDVTDYQSILRDSVEIEVHYQGWSSGFSATLDFEMIEGTPARNLIKMQNVYRPRGFSFRNTADVELNHLPAVDIPLESTTQFAALHVLPTGHGFDNSLNCAEFCKKDYYVKLDGQTRFTQSMWRDDCGLNPIYPQGGTWLYDRANWCPGTKAWTYEHDLSPWIGAGQTAQIDLDLEPYSVPSGDPQAASYNWSTILLEFDSYAHQNDVELMEILSPSIHEEYSRMNPSCGTALVRIRNKGAQRLTSCVIEYGYENATRHSFTWQGDLGMMEDELVVLDLGGPGDWQQSQASDRFTAKVSLPNGMPDEYAWNDNGSSSFRPTPVHAGNLRLNIRTNASGGETWWELKDGSDSVFYSGDGYNNYQFVNEDLNLSPGCYHLQINDRGKDGLQFWANNDGNGYARLYEQGVGLPLKTFLADFGSRIDYWFIVGSGLGVETLPDAGIDFYPNPAREEIELFWSDGSAGLYVQIYDLSGRLISADRVEGAGSARWSLSNIPSGAYLIELHTENGHGKRERLLVQ